MIASKGRHSTLSDVCFPSPAPCSLPPVPCFLSPVSCPLSPVSCPLSPVPCFLSPAPCPVALPGRAYKVPTRLTTNEALHFEDRERREDSRGFELAVGDDLVLVRRLGGDQVEDLAFLIVE